jgi:hypothetical protein
MLVARIEHIGSTPVLGLPAKPIIDIQIIVQNETAAQQRQPILVEHGYSEAVAPIRFFHQPAGWPDVITCIYEKTATPRRAGRACFVIGSGRTRGNAWTPAAGPVTIAAVIHILDGPDTNSRPRPPALARAISLCANGRKAPYDAASFAEGWRGNLAVVAISIAAGSPTGDLQQTRRRNDQSLLCRRAMAA